MRDRFSSCEVNKSCNLATWSSGLGRHFRAFMQNHDDGSGVRMEKELEVNSLWVV